MIGPSDLKDLQKQFQEQQPLEQEQGEEYLVEHLDYQYIQNCTNVKELQLLQNVLESGKEGFYPQLLEFIKTRIHTLQPVEKEIVDFVNLANELKEMENSLSDLVTSKSVVQENVKILMEKNKSQRIKSDDYRAWDTLDVDQELEKINTCDIMIKDGKLSELPNLESKLNVDISKIKLKSKGEIEVLAEQEKVKGNECFKAGEYNDAIVFYTRSLQLLKRAHVFTNRANAFLKIGQYERAEMDSSAALELNDTLYIFKAYVRRAEARRKRGKLWDALQDIDAALKLDSKSSLASNLRIQIENEYKKVEGDLAKDTRGPKSRIKIQEDSVAELQPSSIIEVTDQEAQDFIPQKTMKEQKVDGFVQGLKTDSAVEIKDEKFVKDDLQESLKAPDIKAAGDNCCGLKSKINVIDKEGLDDDCQMFLGLINSKEDISVVELEDDIKKANIEITDTEGIDDDCRLFKSLIQSKANGDGGECGGLPDTKDDVKSIENAESVSFPVATCNDQESIQKAHSFVAPKSSIEFEATWNSIKGDLKLFSSYLSCIDEKEIMKYLATVNNADLHIDFILSTEYIQDAEEILRFLEFATTLPRFKVVKSFMTRKQKVQLAETLERLKSGHNDDSIVMLFNHFNL